MSTAIENYYAIQATMSDRTCGTACWEAHEDVCRCSCGGANHGILRRDPSAPQPARTAKIGGILYGLAGVGVGFTAMQPYTGYRVNGDRGDKAYVKSATASQLKWPELAPIMEKRAASGKRHHCPPQLLWVRHDVPVITETDPAILKAMGDAAYAARWNRH